MNKRRLLSVGIAVNFGILVVISIIAVLFSENTNYMQIGPNSTLTLIGIRINTVQKYLVLLLFIALVQISDSITSEMLNPILGFTIYNPDKKRITEFGKNELQIYANCLFIIQSLKGTIMLLVTITQIDIALFKTLVSELTAVVTIRMLLNQKEFCAEGETQNLLVN